MKKLSKTVRPKDRIIKLEGEIEALKWLQSQLPDMDIAFVKNGCTMPVSIFLEESAGDLKEFIRNYIKQSIELFEGELQRLTKVKNRNRIKYNGDGINTCRVCGRTLRFEAYDREDYAYKQKIKTRGKVKTVYYCGYNCRRKDN